MEILKLKKKIYSTMHQKDEVVQNKDRTQVVCNIQSTTTRCDKDKQSYELNHNYGALFVQA